MNTIASKISDIQITSDHKFSFKYGNETIILRQPLDVILGDNETTKLWIAKYYGFILSVLDYRTESVG